MEFKQIDKIVKEHLKLITITGKGLSEAKERAAKFLVIMAILNDFKRITEENLAKINTLRDANLAMAIQEAAGKTITEKKTNAALNNDFSNAREQVEESEAMISWTRTYIKIFEHAHLTYRAAAKE